MRQLLFIVFSWRLFLFLPFFITLGFLSTQNNFLGGELSNYIQHPFLWGWANFDGEHYLSIARYGYQSLQYFFFPVYPLLISFLAKPFSDTLFTYLLSGLFVSHASFFLAILGLSKLLTLDYKLRTRNFILLSLLLFPTSFYFAGVYTESLFFCLVVWSFYSARVKRWWLVGLLLILATGTRLIGIVLLPALLFEWFSQHPKVSKQKAAVSLFFLLCGSLGLLLYMHFLKVSTGDPLYFFNNINIYGDQRSNHLISLPQVFYRYTFKILPHLSFSYFPMAFTSILEFLIGVLFLGLSLYSLRILRRSYSLFLLGGYLIPTLSGSFSSMPRYVLVLFPGFIVLGILIERLPKSIQLVSYVVMAATLTVAQALFIKGYWLA